MTQFTMASLEEAGSAAREFWEDDLEMALDPILARVRENGVMDEWVGGRTGRQASVLCANLSIGGDGSVRERKNDLRAIGGDDLMPYLLVDQFSKFKSKIATIEFAKEVLTEGSLNTCRIKDDVFDKTALLFAMYHRRPEDLRVVFHLDKIHKSGFARMTLGETTRRRRESFEDFLQPEVVKGTLADFDVAKRDGRTSEFKDVVAHRDSQLVFIRRAERPDLILRSGGVVHGHRPEWIILDFQDNAKRVNISSVSVSVPLEIANRLASRYFGQTCEYENESRTTYTRQLERFLGTLKDDQAEGLRFVELVVANSPLDGAPKIKITDPDSNAIGGAIGHFETAVGGLLSGIERIESIKVHYRKKRVSLIFNKEEEVKDGYVVRYSDHRLNATERRSFEDHMGGIHGISVLSTEKRFKR